MEASADGVRQVVRGRGSIGVHDGNVERALAVEAVLHVREQAVEGARHGADPLNSPDLLSLGGQDWFDPEEGGGPVHHHRHAAALGQVAQRVQHADEVGAGGDVLYDRLRCVYACTLVCCPGRRQDGKAVAHRQTVGIDDADGEAGQLLLGQLDGGEGGAVGTAESGRQGYTEDRFRGLGSLAERLYECRWRRGGCGGELA